MEKDDLRLAVLIDADNAPRSAIKDVMAEVAVYGTPTLKRIYGDWTSPNMGSWKPLLLENAITPIQQYGYTTGKNSTDSAMIIDAMDILYSGRVDGFVLVSSDSDFTRLAIRLREAGMKVYGMGERKTPNPFIVACDKFVYIEVIRAAGEKARAQARAAAKEEKPAQPGKGKEPGKETAKADTKAESTKNEAKSEAKGETKAEAKAEGGQKSGRRRKKAQESPPQPEPVPEPIPEPAPEPPPAEPQVPSQRVPPEVIALIADSLEDIADEDGYAFMGELGNLLVKKQPDFDPRNFGFSKLTQLVKSLERFEIDVRQTSAPHVKHIYLRDKQHK